jgi:predicted outer membrane repeat protein
MRLRSVAVLALGLLSALAIAPGANSQGRHSCLVSNERTGMGARSLQEAIDAAAPGDMLVVKGTCFGSSIVDKNLTLKGVSNPAFGDATLDGTGSGASSVLAVAAPVANLDVAIDNLTITHGSGDGICSCGFSFHAIELTRTTVSENDGSGITGFLGSVTLVDSVVSGNAGFGIAGRISSTLLRSSVEDNEGVGIAASRAGTSSLTDSTVKGNGEGGISSFRTSLSIVGSDVSDNDGPGVAFFEASVSLNGSTVRGNTTSGSGGGISSIDGTARIVNSSVTGNTAALDGGGLHVGVSGASFTIVDSTVAGNTAGGNGGGIHVAGSLTLTDSNVSGNAAASGGGIFNAGTATLVGTNSFFDNIPEDCVGVSGC